MDIVDFISRERLKTYEDLTDRKERAIALHNQTLQLGSSLMSMIALFELALRNSIDTQIAATFGDKEWLVSGLAKVPLLPRETDAIGGAIRHAQKADYAKLSYDDKRALDVVAFPKGVPADITHATRAKSRQKTFRVTHGQVMSQTTFNLWKRLFSSDYANLLWKPCIKKVFPNKNLDRSDVSLALEKVYTVRNRVAHHEPVYGNRLHSVIEALDFLRDNIGAKANDKNTQFQKFSRLQHLRLRMDYENFMEAWETLAV
ncbi:hypothetical protein N7I30_09785 [Aurantimonas litoralis]|nr:hypothetical protein [Aurantimonas litoralis]